MQDRSSPRPASGSVRHMSRRQLLAAAAAAAATSPLYRLRRAYAQSAVAPLRLVCWPLQNGAESNYWYPGGAGQVSMITEPMRKHAGIMSFIRGVNVSGSVNHYAIRSTYTGANVGSYTSANPTVKSIDQIVADHIAATSPMPVKSLHLGVIPADSLNAYQRGQSMSFFAPAPVDYEANPVTAYDRLWAGAAAPMGPAPGAADFTPDLLDLVDAELNELDGKLKGTDSEIKKLGQHREALRGLRPSTDKPGAQMPAAGSALASVEKLRPLIQGNAKDAYKRDYFNDLFDAQIDIMGRALTTGLTRVVTLQPGSADNNLLVPVDGKGYPHHNTSHGNQGIFSRVQQYYFTKMAKLCDLLDVPDPLAPGKTVLDNTLILMFAECLPVSHSSSGVPTLLVGKLGGKIKAGGMYTGGTNKNVNATVLRAFGLDGAQFGNTLVAGALS